MAEGPSNHHHLIIQPPQQRARTQHNSRLGPRSGGAGEIVEVQGGHIVRSTGRKDRHSKVCTAKGPRDRRVRLSAHTAIQFYDVQDRLGYDRPSKAVDWLIKNAKVAIDELAQLPAWHPTATCTRNPASLPDQTEHAVEHESSSPYAAAGFGAAAGSSCFLPPSLDSDAIADTIKSFFPIAAAAAAAAAAQSTGEASSPMGYQNYPPDLLSRSSSSSQNQDLRLSLQSFPNPDPVFHHQQNQQQQQQQQHVLFSGLDSSSTAAASMAPWAEASVGGGYVYSIPLQLQLQQQAAAMNHHQMMLGQLPASQFFTQRGTLQSSNPPFARAAWIDSPIDAAHSAGFAFGSSGFSGFRIPTRVQGEEEHDGLSDKPSSASSSSHH